MTNLSLKLRMLTLFFCGVIATAHCASAADIVRYRIPSNGVDTFKHQDYVKGSYALGLLKLALEHSKPEFGDYVLQPSTAYMNVPRTILSLSSKQHIDVMWREESPRMSQLKSIDIPLLRGYGDQLILLIHKDNKEKFSRITRKEQLQSLSAGGIKESYLTELMLAQNYHVIAAHRNLYHMLNLQRFDYVPMQLHEAHYFPKRFPDLVIQENIMLSIERALKYFVHPDNTRLHQRITNGLRILEANGLFKQHFENHADMKFYKDFNKDKHYNVFPLID